MADNKDVKPDTMSMIEMAYYGTTGQSHKILLALSEKFALDFLNAARRTLDHQPATMAKISLEANTGNAGFAYGQVAGHLTDNFLAAAQRGASQIYTPPAVAVTAEAPAQTGTTTTVAPKGPGGTNR